MSFLSKVLNFIFFGFIGLLLFPSPKRPKPEAAKDLEDPTAEAGMPIPVPFGEITIKGLNTLWYGEKSNLTTKVKA
jgi:hypothetical protein